MDSGRSVYSFQFSCDGDKLNDLIQDYLQTNKYQLKEDNGEKYYRSGDPIVKGYRFFNYTIQNQTLTIYVWVKGLIGEMPIENNDLNVASRGYLDSLKVLFDEISKLNSGGISTNDKDNISFDASSEQLLDQNVNVNQQAQNFNDKRLKMQETICEIVFWISMIGLLFSLTGISVGLIFYVLDIGCALQGLNTKKRNKAFATIVMSIISIVILILLGVDIEFN